MSGAASAGARSFGNQRDGDGGRDHVIRIAAIEIDAGDLMVFGAGEEIAAAAFIAMAAMFAMPADADALAGFPFRDARADGVDDADDFVAGDAGILNAGEQAGFGNGIAMANAAGLDFDPDGAGTGLGNFAFDEFKGSVGFGNLSSAHFWHKVFGLWPGAATVTISFLSCLRPTDYRNRITAK